MCGLSGIIHWDGKAVQRADLMRQLELLRHRGPDEARYNFPEAGVGMAHTRLRVIDLSGAARQPMSSEDGRHWLIYNGEIYNFQELREELRSLGCRFRSQSDTEVVLHAYRTWGADAVCRLDGMFAFAIWDVKQHELFLARDRVGKKPLYYWTDGTSVVFASEIKALISTALVPCEVHDDVLPFVIAMGYPPTGETCYKGIRQLPPATRLRLNAGDIGVEPEVYWKLSMAARNGSFVEDQAVQEIKSLLKDAVRRRLISDVPLGCFLSGGVDSTIITGLMNEFSGGRPVRTFSIGFKGDSRYDETRFAQQASDHFGTHHTAFVVSPQSFSILERLVELHDQPFGDASALPTYLLSQLAREHVAVALSGDGGDEMFAGYDRFTAALWRRRIPRFLLWGADRFLRGLPSGSEKSLLSRLKRFTSDPQLGFHEKFILWTTYPDSVRGAWGLNGDLNAFLVWRHPSLAQVWKESSGWTDLARLLHLNFREYLPNDLLVKMDRSSMAHGLEVRSPFLDTRLLERAASFPDRFKLDGGRTKTLLRKAFPGFLTKEIFNRPKMGFAPPLGTWFKGRWRDPMMDLLGSGRPQVSRLVDPQVIQRLIRFHLAGKVDAGRLLWLLMTFEVWLRRVSKPAPGAAVAQRRG